METLDWLNQHAMKFLLGGFTIITTITLVIMVLRKAWGHWRWQ